MINIEAFRHCITIPQNSKYANNQTKYNNDIKSKINEIKYNKTKNKIE